MKYSDIPQFEDAVAKVTKQITFSEKISSYPFEMSNKNQYSIKYFESMKVTFNKYSRNKRKNAL